METSPEKKLYDYTKALASSLSVTRGDLNLFLPNIYLENRRIPSENPSLVYTGDYPDRYSQAYDTYLDLIGTSFGIFRGPNESDDAYRQKIKLVLVQNHTISGIKNSVETLFSGLGLNVVANVFNESSNTFDAVSNNFETPFRKKLGARYYRIYMEIFPEVKQSVPNLVDFLFPSPSGTPYRVKKSGVYSIVFDPYEEQETSPVDLFIKNTQFPDLGEKLLYTNSSATSKLVFNLGFLSSFSELIYYSSNSSFEAHLTFNENQFAFYRNPAYNGLLTSFGVNFLREIFNDIMAFGVIIERIVIRNSGSGG